MQLSNDALVAVWDTLVNFRISNRAPRDVVRAFASLGGSDAEAVYCTSFSEESQTTWWILAVSGGVLIHVRAVGPGIWNADDDNAESVEVEAFAAPISTFVTAVHVTDSRSVSPRRPFDDEEPVSPWVASWAIQSGQPCEKWSLPHRSDRGNPVQYDRAERVARAVLERLDPSR